MENCSINNSIMISSSSDCEKTTDYHDHCSEESGWTTYLEDFFANNSNTKDHDDEHLEQHTSFYFDDAGTNCPMDVSDAASLVVNNKKSTADYNHDQDDHDHEHDHVDVDVVGLPIDSRRDVNKYSSRSLSLKKRRTKEAALVDDALEDTASSPASSPKVYEDMIYLQFKRNTKQKEKMDITLDKGSGSRQQIIDRRSDLGFVGGQSDSTQLKKRGLCLVPLSMVVNYLG